MEHIEHAGFTCTSFPKFRKLDWIALAAMVAVTEQREKLRMQFLSQKTHGKNPHKQHLTKTHLVGHKLAQTKVYTLAEPPMTLI